jgi:hypothetical protein
VRSGDKLVQNLLVAAMNAVEDTYSQPGILEVEIIKGMILQHVS